MKKGLILLAAFALAVGTVDVVSGKPIKPTQKRITGKAVAKARSKKTDAQIKIIQTLLATGKCNLSAKNTLGQTALHTAAKGKNLIVVQALVGAGADLNAKDNNGKTVLDLAKDQKIKTFLQDKMGVTATSTTGGKSTGGAAKGVKAKK